MSRPKFATTIQILSKKFHINSPPEKIAELKACAHYLENKILQLRKSSQQDDFEQLVVLASINMAYELMAQEEQVTSLQTRMEALLAE